MKGPPRINEAMNGPPIVGSAASKVPSDAYRATIANSPTST